MATARCPGQGLLCGSSHLAAPALSSAEQVPQELRLARCGWCSPQPLAVRISSAGQDNRARKFGVTVRRRHPATADGAVGGSGTAEGGGPEPESRAQGQAVDGGGSGFGKGEQEEEMHRRMVELFGRLADSTGKGRPRRRRRRMTWSRCSALICGSASSKLSLPPPPEVHPWHPRLTLPPFLTRHREGPTTLLSPLSLADALTRPRPGTCSRSASFIGGRLCWVGLQTQSRVARSLNSPTQTETA